MKNIENSFKNFIKQSGEVALNMDCSNLRKLAKAEDKEKVVTYSIVDTSADIYVKNIEVDSMTTSYEVLIKGKSVGRFTLSIPGAHNISNSLPVIYFANKFGVSFDEIRERLKNFKGARRRFDVLYDKDIKIVDDYAHHPTEIKATLQAVRERTKGRVVAIFQPHRYSRVKFLWDKFEGVFDSADDIILLPTYSAGEENIYGITSEDLAKKIAPKGNIRVFGGEKEIYENIKGSEEQTMYLFMGAGDISSMAHNITKLLENN